MTESLTILTLELLRAGRARITDPRHWTQRLAARNSSYRAVHPRHSDAVCFCSFGALQAEMAEARLEPAMDTAWNALQDTLALRGVLESIATFNDTHTHEEVLALWDETIKRWEAKYGVAAIQIKEVKSLAKIRKQCKREGVLLDDGAYKALGSDHVVLRSPGAHVVFNALNGRFWGETPDGVLFHTDNCETDDKPWFQALLKFFYEYPEVAP